MGETKIVSNYMSQTSIALPNHFPVWWAVFFLDSCLYFLSQPGKMKWILFSQNSLLKSYELSGLFSVHWHKENQSFCWKISKQTSSQLCSIAGTHRHFQGAWILWLQLDCSCVFSNLGPRDKMQHEIFKHSKAHLPCNPLIFVAASSLLIQNGKEKKNLKRQQRGKMQGERKAINPFFCCSSSSICEQLSQLLVKLYLTCCQHEFSKNPM